MKKGNAIALLPIGVFLCIYLGLGILFEYVMKIPLVPAFFLAVSFSGGSTSAAAGYPDHYRISCGNSGGVSAES